MKFAYAEHIQLFENVNEATSVNELTTLVKLFSLVQPQFYIWRDQGGGWFLITGGESVEKILEFEQ